MASGGSFFRTDLWRINNVIQNTHLAFPKELIIAILRDEFSKDSYFKFVMDSWGFPKTPDLTGTPTDAGLEDELTTRIFIGEAYRFDTIFYPAILVRTGGSSYKPISLSRNKETVQNQSTLVIDGYGNQKVFTTPKAFTLAGAWEGTMQVDILTRDIVARDQLASFCALLFTDIRFEELQKAGVLITKVDVGSPSETEDRQQDKLYKTQITLGVRTEWRREIPVKNVVDVINICVEFGRLDTTPATIAPNLTINTTVELIDQIDNL